MALNLWSQPSLWPQLVSGSPVARMSWPEVKVKGKKASLQLCGLAFISAGVARRPGGADGQKRTDRPRATVQGLSLCRGWFGTS